LPRESKAAKRQRAGVIVERLAEMYPNARCSLVHENAFQLLVATVLSAQCTDARVNMVTPALFARFPTSARLAEAPIDELEELIRSTGFFRSKAKALIGLSQGLEERFGGQVPTSIEDLTSLEGVGRKTANVVRGVMYGLAEGVVVDTHMKRVAYRLGLTRQTDPELVERDLIELIPESERVVFTHRIIDHGRAICVARKPRCGECALSEHCPSSLIKVGTFQRVDG
jgi:endonuclease III